MLENLSRDPPWKSAPVTEDTVIPDPWELTSPIPRFNSINKSWQFPQEHHPLISPAERGATQQLPAPRAEKE
ncbi:MAG TPA: hypothetical protein DDZ80_11470 [Cyanobacteria bacterium UBA8803]|nr:hypothetical protein [Cyanobacteria bacterium UBA8803]